MSKDDPIIPELWAIITEKEDEIARLKEELNEVEGHVLVLQNGTLKKETKISNLREVIDTAADCLPEDPLECERILNHAIEARLSKGEEVT